MKKAAAITLILALVVGFLNTYVGVADTNGYKYLYPINVKGKWGYVDSKGKVVVKPQYAAAQEFSEGMAAVCVRIKGIDRWGYIDSRGKVIIKPQYEIAKSFSEGLAAVKKDYSYSETHSPIMFIDKKGKVVFNVKDSEEFIDTEGFHDGVAALYQYQHISTKVKYIDKKGKEIREEQVFDWGSEITTYSSGLRRILNNNWETGYLDAADKTVISPQYDRAMDFYSNVAWVRKDNKWRLIDKSGKELKSTDLQILSNYYNGYAKVQSGQWDIGKWGYIDRDGKMVIPPKYNYAMNFSEGLAAVKQKGYVDYAIGMSDGGFEYIDTAGKTVIAPSYGFAEAFKNGMACVFNNDHSFIDKTGKEVFKAFSPYFEFSEGYLAVRLGNGKYQYLDKEGKTAIDSVFDEAYNFREGLARVKIGGKYGFIDSTGKAAIEPKYTYAGDFSEGLSLVKSEGKYYYIDMTGTAVIAISGMDVLEHTATYSDSGFYSEIKSSSEFHEGLAVVKANNKFGFIDKSGKVIIAPIFDFVSEFNEGYAVAKKGETCGFIDKSGQFVIKTEYEIVSGFQEGRAVIAEKRGNNGQYRGYIDKSGYVVIKPQFSDSGSFSDGLAKVRFGAGSGKIGLVDGKGNVVFAPKYDDLGNVSENLVSVMEDNKWGYMDLKGKMTVKPQFDKAYEFKGGIAKVQLSGKTCYIDKNGRFIWKQSN